MKAKGQQKSIFKVLLRLEIRIFMNSFSCYRLFTVHWWMWPQWRATESGTRWYLCLDYFRYFI